MQEDGRAAGAVVGAENRLAAPRGVGIAIGGGQPFEVTAEGAVVWEFINRWDEDEAVVTSEAQRYPSDYLPPDLPTCD